METKDLKLEDAQAKFDEFNGVAEAERTDEQKADITQLDGYIKEFTEYNTLKGKEAQLNDTEADRYLELGEKFSDVAGKVEKPKETPPVEPPVEMYAGVYKTKEDLINGIRNSDEGLDKLIGELSPEQLVDLEGYYKDNQKVVSRINEAQKKAPKAPPKTVTPKVDVINIPLNQRRIDQMSQEDYGTWQKEKPMEAQAWLTKATNLSVSQEASRKRVFAKHPTWLAEINGILPASKELLEFDRIQKEREDEFMVMADGPEACEKETMTSFGKPPVKPKVKPNPSAKPGFEQGPSGKGGGPPSGKGTMTEEEFEKLSPEEQDKVMEGSVFDK